MRALPALLALPLLAAAAPAPKASAPAPAPAPAKKEEPVPKALPRDGDGSPQGERVAASLPPFLGLFGPAPFIQKVGFRSSPGRYIEYALVNAGANAPSGARMRIQEVGPSPGPGERWLEVLAQTGTEEGNGMRMLTKGEKVGNIQRMVASMPGFPAMEFPLDSVRVQPDQEGGAPDTGGAMDNVEFGFGTPKKIGKETVEVPLGKFETEHWLIEAKAGKMDFWVTSDPKIPFIGAVKMTSPEGTALASKVGTDAIAKISVPGKAN